MTMFGVLVDPILPVFAILGVGFAMGRAGRVSLDEARVINRLAMTVLVPILVFDLVASAPFEAFRIEAVAVYALAEAAVFAMAYGLARRFGCGRPEAVALGWAALFANNVYFGLPITRLMFGEGAALLPVTSVVILDSMVTMAILMAVLQALTGEEARPLRVLAGVARIPVLQALVGGLAVKLAGLGLPAPVQTFVGFTGGAAAPVALFALGVVLADIRFRRDPLVMAVTGLKILALPFLVWLGLSALPMGHAEVALYVIAAAGPAGATALNVALLYGVPTGRVGQVLVASTFLSLLSLSALAGWAVAAPGV